MMPSVQEKRRGAAPWSAAADARCSMADGGEAVALSFFYEVVW